MKNGTVAHLFFFFSLTGKKIEEKQDADATMNEEWISNGSMGCDLFHSFDETVVSSGCDPVVLLENGIGEIEEAITQVQENY